MGTKRGYVWSSFSYRELFIKGEENKVQCDMKGHANSSQTQYLFTIHHDSCFGVYSNSTSVQATLIVQVIMKILIIIVFSNFN